MREMVESGYFEQVQREDSLYGVHTDANERFDFASGFRRAGVLASNVWQVVECAGAVGMLVEQLR